MKDIKYLQKLAKDFTVLYVEDDLSIQTSMLSYLKKLFKDVLPASDGVEGLKLYDKEIIDIVITDLSMPKMNGLEMLKEIKKINERQAILITSAHSESEYMFGAIKIGIDGYIIKPFDYSQLNHELYKIVEQLKNFKENEQYKIDLKDMVDKKTVEISNMLIFQSNNYEKTILSMVEMIEQRDTYTAGHSKRVAEYSKKIAKEMAYSEDDCTKLYQAGILHDIGKIATPDAVLLNPRALNSIEYKLIQEHVIVGYNLLKNIPMFANLADIIISHHEKYDGSGYPNGLSGNNINMLSHIMIVADAFDAMTTNRIYKAKKDVDEAIKELIELKSKQFHPDVVDSAVIVLKDISIDENINQLPKTHIEEERFAYFYKDPLVNVYNQNYLDLILLKNSHEKNFKYITLFSIRDFSMYNKKNSWKQGDKFLTIFAMSLSEHFQDNLIFRIFGDDFAIISKEKLNLEKVKIELDKISIDNSVKYNTQSIDLNKVNISNISEIENAFL